MLSRSRFRIGILCLGAALLLTAPALAESKEASDGGGLPAAGGIDGHTSGSWITSNPKGAMIQLAGASTVRGFTPWRVDDRIRGSYAVQANLPGYETWRGNVHLDGSLDETYSLELSPKTKGKALVRSLIIPGWGQRYAGARSRGNVFLAAEAATLLGLLITHENYQDKVDNLDGAWDRYTSEPFEENLDSRYRDVARARNRADDAYTLRQVFFWGSVGVMALNVVDVLLFTPVGPSSGVFLVSPTNVTASGPDGPDAQVGLQYRF